MTDYLSLLWTRNRTIGRLAYLLTGIALFAVKFAIDWAIANGVFGQSWSPMNYLIWPNDRTFRILDPTNPQRTFALAMLAVSLPFIWTGVILTLHRLRAADMPLILVVLFFVPLVNLLFFLVLSLLPSRSLEPEAPQTNWEPARPAEASQSVMTQKQFLRTRTLRSVHRQLTRESYWRSGLVALLVTVPVSVMAVGLETVIFQNYGFSLFVGGPFALGLFSSLIFGFSRPQPLGQCFLVALSATGGVAVSLLVFGFEGLICLIMAAPIIVPIIFIGTVVGYAIQTRPWLNDQTTSLALMVMFVLPTLMAAEASNEPKPDIRNVCTEVIVGAEPEKVWPLVIAFPPLPEPDDWFFQTGVAYPQRAEIHGTGVGAVRHCVFSTGAFVEPIEVWDPPSVLRFTVTEQPEPMREWSPYELHPAHLDHYLVSLRGEFFLAKLPGGRTRLQGTTWYTNRMWPAAYWDLWSDYIIHRIHERVLTHIRNLAEEKE